jgi:adenosylhomocysteine nucleosidase
MSSYILTPETPQLFLTMVFATIIEAEPFIHALDMAHSQKSPFPIFSHNDMALIISGIGKANAAAAITYCSICCPSQYILNLGCAGALNPLYKQGDIFQISKAIEPDRPHLRTGTPYSHTPSLLPHFSNAILATQDKPVFDPDERLNLSHLADLADMEGAAAIQAAGRSSIPILLYKFVSDTIDDKDGDSTIPFVREYSKHFYNFVSREVISVLRKEMV